MKSSLGVLLVIVSTYLECTQSIKYGCANSDGSGLKIPKGNENGASELTFEGFSIKAEENLGAFDVRVHKQNGDAGQICYSHNGGKIEVSGDCPTPLDGIYIQFHPKGSQQLSKVCEFNGVGGPKCPAGQRYIKGGECIKDCPQYSRRVGNGNQCECIYGKNENNGSCRDKPVQLAPKFKMCLYDGKDCGGHDIRGVDNQNQQQCEQLCLNLPGCLSAQSNKENKKCWLKNFSCTLAQMSNVGSGRMLRKIPSDQSCSWWPAPAFTMCVHDGKDCGGHDIKGVDNQNQQQCEQLCLNLPGCLSAQSNKANKKCWLKNFSCTWAQMSNAGDGRMLRKIPGDKSCSWWPAPAFKMCLHDGKDCGGNDIRMVPNQNQQQCEQQCLNEARCLSAQSNKSDKKCWLKYKSCTLGQMSNVGVGRILRKIPGDKPCSWWP